MNRTERRKYWCEGEGLNEVSKMLIEEYSHKQIAEAIGIAARTLYEWRNEEPELDKVITCKGIEGIEYERIYNEAAGVGRNFSNLFYKDGVEVFWCNQCRGFYAIDDYVVGNVTCRGCNATNSSKYRRTEQGKVVKQEYARRYYHENKDLIYEAVYKRHNRILSNDYNYNSEMWDEVLKYFNNECAYCGEDSNLQREHVVPVSKGGGYVSENIIPACRYCNMSKLDNDMEEWYRGYRHYDEERLNKINEWTNY